MLCQINCTTLRKFSLRRKCIKLIKNGCVHALGSDYHRIERGYALLDEGVKILHKKLKADGLNRLIGSSESIEKNVALEEILSV